jgi:hypothetical protein
MSNEATRLQQKVAGTAALDERGPAGAAMLFDFPPQCLPLAADGAAGTTIAATKFWTNPFDFAVLVVGLTVSADAAVAADANNYGTEIILADNGAGAAAVQAATYSTQTAAQGALVQNVGKAGVVATTNIAVPAGGNLWYQQTKTGTGVQFPLRTLGVRLRRL